MKTGTIYQRQFKAVSRHQPNINYNDGKTRMTGGNLLTTSTWKRKQGSDDGGHFDILILRLHSQSTNNDTKLTFELI